MHVIRASDQNTCDTFEASREYGTSYAVSHGYDSACTYKQESLTKVRGQI